MTRQTVSQHFGIDVAYITTQPENEVFDCKKAKVSAGVLAELISSFANTKGGTIAIGVTDKKRELEGIRCAGQEHINDLLNAHLDGCLPMPQVVAAHLPVTNIRGEQDSILLLHVKESPNQIIRTRNNSVFIRLGDRTKELKGEALRNFEYERSVRSYESECNTEACMADLDPVLLMQYKEDIAATNLSDEQVLRSRGMMRTLNGTTYLTHAALLLFGRDVRRFYPGCRVRFLRYEGDKKQGGEAYNIIKDVQFESALPKILDRVRVFVSGQLRDFTALNETGRFVTVPEYPEFAWLEGVVNAVTHREYACAGDYIRISMYDNRLEIESPGKLPYPVTVDNIREMRQSRNPIIARALTDMKWVRELNEGVPRIYADMSKAFLDAPEFTETNAGVRLVLKNNIHSRKMRQHETSIKLIGIEQWETLDDIEKNIIVYLGSHRDVKNIELANIAGVSPQTCSGRLKRLIEKKLVVPYGAKTSPTRTYNLVVPS